MAHKPPKATLASSKGGNLLADLKKKMEPEELVRSSVKTNNTADRPQIEDELKAAFAHRGGRPPVRTTPTPKIKREKGKEYIKIANPEVRRAVIAEVRQIGVSKSASRPSCRSDLGEQAFNKLALLRTQVEGFSANFRGPDGQSTDNAVSRRVDVGSQQIDEVVDADDGFFLGYDFGTSTTKAIARYPYGGIDDAFAIDVPTGVSNEPHLWPTTVWFDPLSGTFSLTPLENAVRLHSFKEALLEGRGLRICAGSGVMMAEAAVAFLAQHFAYCLGSALEQQPNFKLAGVNVGVPVAALKTTPTIALFEQVVKAALFLIPFASVLTLNEVKSALEKGEHSRIVPTLNTELAGAIAGYCAMPRPYVGGHMIIDCGSATLDMASFALDGSSLRPIAIYEARVEHLGADACAAYEQLGASLDECRSASRYLEHLVFARTRQFDRSRFAQSEGAFPYQVILVGGGIHSEVHEPLFKIMEAAFHRPFHRPELAPGLRYNPACEAGRLILADGLARDPIELRKVAMPGDPPPPTQVLPEMISKDQV